MTRQEMFDAAVRGLRAQGWEQSADHVTGEADARCLYRGPRGLKCALGHCVSDGDLALAAESHGVEHFEDLNSYELLEALGGGDWEALDFASAMQRAHDEAPSPGEMKHAFRDLGDVHGLTWPEEPADA